VGQAVIGLEVNHAHIHLIPMQSEADIDFKHHVKMSEDELKAASEKIQKAFQQL
jgi:HIT family protein